MAAISALVSTTAMGRREPEQSGHWSGSTPQVFAPRENRAVGAKEAGEAGVKVAAIEEGVDGRGGLGGKAGDVGGVVVENQS
jgi:hypothetical protein